MEEKIRVLPTHIVSAAGVVTNAEGKVLMVKTYNSGWVFPGGQVEVGENLIDAVKREILEESGIEAEVGELFAVTSNTCKRPGYNGVKEIPTIVNFDFICRATGGSARPSEENSETGWFSEEEALSLITAPAIIHRFNAYLTYTGRPLYLEYITHPAFQLKLARRL